MPLEVHRSEILMLPDSRTLTLAAGHQSDTPGTRLECQDERVFRWTSINTVGPLLAMGYGPKRRVGP